MAIKPAAHEHSANVVLNLFATLDPSERELELRVLILEQLMDDTMSVEPQVFDYDHDRNWQHVPSAPNNPLWGCADETDVEVTVLHNLEAAPPTNADGSAMDIDRMM